MVLKYWWMIVVWVLVAVIGVVIWRRYLNKRRVSHGGGTVVVAHSERLRALPSYAMVLKKYRLLVRVLMVCLVVAVGSALLLSARPASTVLAEPSLHNRDIMLCLDVSGSMTQTVHQITSTYAKLADKLHGERIGLVVFDSSASTVFPLTDDYEFIKKRLSEVAEQLNDTTGYGGSNSVYNGIYEGEGSSLVGDGLASCVTRFDNLDTKRSRSVILATDNYANGAQIVDLKQAGAYARDKGVRVYGVNPSDYSDGSYTDPDSQEFREVVLATDGGYFKIDYEQRGDMRVVEQIIEQIGKQEATRYKGAPQLVQTDAPIIPAAILCLSIVGLLIVAWRLKV
ncbi:MAG: VWA domain-containing protein [Candidatus Saccharimonas sp.]